MDPPARHRAHFVLFKRRLLPAQADADPPPGWDGASPGHLYAAWSFPAPALTVRPHVLALTVAARRLVHAAAYYRMRFESSVMGQHMVRGCVAPLKRDLHE